MKDLRRFRTAGGEVVTWELDTRMSGWGSYRCGGCDMKMVGHPGMAEKHAAACREIAS